ncbi:MAG: hypothetical protein KF834_09125 [Burkholderiales bacterium]|nr:hypothetical protein [Burkholderiales bacterium]
MVVTTAGFSTLARFTGKAGGVPDLRIAEYPGPLGIHDEVQIERSIGQALIDQIVDGLTRVDSGPRAAHAGRDPRAIVFAGSVEEISHHFMTKEWSDGLPIIPPTIDRIEAFLKFTDRPPDEPVAVLPSANLQATPWNIAVNAVMAGCLPEHLPLLIAAVEALGDERCSLNNIGSSSGIFPYLLVSGPIVDQLGIQRGPQLVSRGPNPAIGRAVGLIIRNIAGFRPGTSYMGTFGYPLAVVFAEQKESPWPSFHVEHGFKTDDNTVTVGVTNNWGSSPSPYATAEKSGARVALELLCREVIKKTRLFNFPAIGHEAEKIMVTMLLSPPVAESLAEEGYSKADVKRYVYEHATMRLEDYDWVLRYTATMRTNAKKRVEIGVLPPEFAGAPDDRVRVLSSPELLHIIVCGDPHRNRVMVMEGGHTQPTTKRVCLPENWRPDLRI